MPNSALSCWPAARPLRPASSCSWRRELQPTRRWKPRHRRGRCTESWAETSNGEPKTPGRRQADCGGASSGAARWPDSDSYTKDCGPIPPPCRSYRHPPRIHIFDHFDTDRVAEVVPAGLGRLFVMMRGCHHGAMRVTFDPFRPLLISLTGCLYQKQRDAPSTVFRKRIASGVSNSEASGCALTMNRRRLAVRAKQIGQAHAASSGHHREAADASDSVAVTAGHGSMTARRMCSSFWTLRPP